MKLLKYVVPHDLGLAPNPFGRYCTLALCTPNHMGAKLESGDWIIGHKPKAENYNLIYAMRVSEVLDLNVYFLDKRFEYKKPKLTGNWKQFVGDNMYYKNIKGEWEQAKTALHLDKKSEDTRFAKVYISENFYYLGRKADEYFSRMFPELIKIKSGIEYIYDKEIILKFENWLNGKYKSGRIGLPNIILKNERKKIKSKC